MGQAEVDKLLRKKKKWCTAKELAAELGQSSGTITCNLAKMLKYREVEQKLVRASEMNKNGGEFFLWRAKEW